MILHCHVSKIVSAHAYKLLKKIVIDKIHSISSETFQGVKLASVKMMFDSMSYYEYKAILEIINCYNAMNMYK